jgi:hypothetical protein
MLREVGVVGSIHALSEVADGKTSASRETDAAKGMCCAGFGTSDNPEATPDGE